MHLLLGDVDGEAVHVVLDVAVGAVVEQGARRLLVVAENESSVTTKDCL